MRRTKRDIDSSHRTVSRRALLWGGAQLAFIGGLGVAEGYFNFPALTAARFIPDPFSSKPGSRLYKTGDQTRYDRNGALN